MTSERGMSLDLTLTEDRQRRGRLNIFIGKKFQTMDAATGNERRYDRVLMILLQKPHTPSELLSSDSHYIIHLNFPFAFISLVQD